MINSNRYNETMETALYNHEAVTTKLKQAGMSKAQAARVVGVHWLTIHRACTGEGPVSLKIMKKIAQAVGVPLSEFLAD